jgi:hypothetical protein
MSNNLTLAEKFEKLREPFPADEVHWRVAQVGKGRGGKIWAKVLAYMDNRCVMDRLDEVFGPENWRNEFKPAPATGKDNDSIICGISLRIGDEWITKWDGASNSDIEPTKGGLSDAMKRAAVQWGIGRYLYNIKESWANIDDKGSRYSNSKVKVDGKEEWVSFNWEPPVLPDWALPESERKNRKPPTGNGPQSNAAEPPKRSEAYGKATAAIIEATTLGRIHEIKRNIKKADNKLARDEYDLLLTQAAQREQELFPMARPQYVKAVEAIDKAEDVPALLDVKQKLRDERRKLNADEISELETLIDRKCVSIPQIDTAA